MGCTDTTTPSGSGVSTADIFLLAALAAFGLFIVIGGLFI